MKQPINILLIIIALVLFIQCTQKRTVFTTEIHMALQSDVKGMNIKKANEGYYRFGYCTFETIICNAQVRWFRECYDSLEVPTIGLVFIDSVRVLFFTDPENKKTINLNSPGERVKVGVYHWEKSGAVDTNGVKLDKEILVVRIKDPKSKPKTNHFSDLYFEKNNETLSLLKLTYFDNDNSLINLLPKKKGKKKSRLPAVEDDNSDLRELMANKILAFKSLDYRFNPRPIRLTYNKDSVISISYLFDNEHQFYSRKTLLNGKDALEELIPVGDSKLKLPIKTW